MADITNALNDFKTAPNGESVRDAFVETMTLVNNDNIQIAGEYAEIVAVAGQLQPAVTTATNAATLASQKATEATNAATTSTTKASEATTASNTATTKASEAVAAKDTAVTKAGEATTAATTVVEIRDEILPKLNNIDQKVTDATNAATLATTKASESSASAVTSSDQAVIALNAAGTATTKASEANQSAIDAAESAAEAAASSGITPEEKAIWNAKQDALGFTPEDSAAKGQINGYAGLDGTGKVPLAQLLEIGSGSGDMLKSVYDTNNNGVVDNSEKVNGLTVEKAVPADAKFTDTVKTPEEELTDIKTVDGEGSGLDSDLLDGKHANEFALSSHGTHVTYADTTTALVSGGTGVVGTSDDLAREDHTHSLPAYPDLAGHVAAEGLHTTTEKQTEWNKNTTDIVLLQQQSGTLGANDAAVRREVLDIKLKLDEMNVVEYLNKTGIGFFDLFEDSTNIDTANTTAVMTSTDVTFTDTQVLQMKSQNFSDFTNVELAIYDLLREKFMVTVAVSDSPTISMNITPGSRTIGEKFYHNGEVYTITKVVAP